MEENLDDLDADFLDEIEEEEETKGASFDERFGQISAIQKEKADSPAGSIISMSSLQRMTTIRHIFESYELDISQNTFADVKQALE